MAVIACDVDTVRYLVDKGADTKIKDYVVSECDCNVDYKQCCRFNVSNCWTGIWNAIEWNGMVEWRMMNV